MTLSGRRLVIDLFDVIALLGAEDGALSIGLLGAEDCALSISHRDHASKSSVTSDPFGSSSIAFRVTALRGYRSS